MDDARRRRVAAVLAGAVVVVGLLLALWAAASGPSLNWSHSPGDDEPAVQRTDVPEDASETCPDDECLERERPDTGVFGVIVTILLVLMGVVLLVWVVALMRARGPGLLARRRRSEFERPGEPVPNVAEAVRDDAAQQYEALRTGSPRNAIVACWVRLEDAVMSAGLTVRGSETSSELTQRVLATYGVDDAAITRLAELYREARFSRHDVTESMRTEAIAALERVHASLEHPSVNASEVRG